MAHKAEKSSALSWQPDAATPRDRHRLEGLEPDNLLAFMALLGLLRALETARLAWRPRAFWDVETDPWRPVLTLAGPQTEVEVAHAAAEGMRHCLDSVEELCRAAAEMERSAAKRQAEKLEEKQNEKELNTGERKKLAELRKRADTLRLSKKVTHLAGSPEVLLQLHGSQDPLRERWTASLSAMAVKSDGDRSALSSPLKLTSGQQAFAGLFVTLAKSADANEIARSLYQPWEYRHRGDSFRFDPAEARRYAYMASDPTEKRPKTRGETGSAVAPSERGANVLAAVAFLSFPLITSRNAVLFPGLQDKDADNIRAPFWTVVGGRGATLAGIEALMRQAQGQHDPLPKGMLGWQRFRIVELGDYKAIAYAGFEPLPSVTGIA